MATPRVFLQAKVSAGRGDEGGRKEAALQDRAQDLGRKPQRAPAAARRRVVPGRGRGRTREKPCASQRALRPRLGLADALQRLEIIFLCQSIDQSSGGGGDVQNFTRTRQFLSVECLSQILPVVTSEAYNLNVHTQQLYQPKCH